MIHVDSCSAQARDSLQTLAAVHERLVAAELGSLARPSVIFYSVLLAHGTQPRLSPGEQALLTQVVDEVTKKAYGDDAGQVLLAGFLEASPGCSPQLWHVDYDGNTETLFVPLVPLTAKNGTEYVQWESVERAIQMLAKYGPQIEAATLTDFSRLNPAEAYEIRRAVAEPFTILRMPYYLFHRGVRNEEAYARRVFFVTVAARAGFELTDDFKSPVIIPHGTNGEADASREAGR
jgi:hypothetical protein